MAPDTGAIAFICSQGFSKVHESGFVPEDLSLFCEQFYSIPAIRTDLEKTDRFYLVLTCDGDVVGCLRMAPPTLELAKPDKSGMELARFYLLENHRSGGWGSKMLDMAEAESKRRGFQNSWLHVFIPNIRAQEFYYRHGYTNMGQEQLNYRDSHPTGLVLKKQLAEGAPS